MKDTSFLGVSFGCSRPRYRRYLAGVFVYGCGDFSNTMLILYAVQALTPRYGQGAGAIAIVLYTLHNVLYCRRFPYPVGALADRYGKRPFLLAAYTLGALMNSHSGRRGAVDCHARRRLRPGRGGLCASAVARPGDCGGPHAGGEFRSTGFGVLAAVNGVGDLVSSAIVGALWTAVSPEVAFGYALVMSIAGAIVTGAALRAFGR